MNKIIILFLISASLFSSVQAQHFCGENKIAEQWMNDKASAEKRKLLEKFTGDFVKDYYLRLQQNAPQSDTILYIIPLVFHIMHNYGSENISKAQVLGAVQAMNEYYQKLNSDTSQVVQPFKSIIGDAKIEFRLAQIDPNGNCTDGITRTQTALTYGGDEQLKNIILWPTNKYVNIWVEHHIGWGPFAAYATLPYFPGYTDGIVFDHTFLGSNGTSVPGNAFILAHEMGHILNLDHTWGPTNSPGDTANCSFDDGVADTPNCIGTTTCDTAMASCTPGVLANVQNMMEYSYCNIMFTKGQVARMHACLNDTVGGRNNLWSAANLIATGTNNGYLPQQCAPVADLTNLKIRVCEGDSITFSNLSYGADSINYNWQFTGGNISSSTNSNPTVTYNTSGFYDVTLTAYNSSGSSSITRTSLVEVSPSIASTSVPAMQDFETINFPSGYWDVENITGTAWERNSLASVTGTHSVYIQSDSANMNTSDIFYTESFNLSNIAAPAMNFKLAFSQRNNSTDNLKVFMSTNCGQTWGLRYSKSGNSLQTTIDSSLNFIPASNQWRQESVQISTAAGNDNVRFKFLFTSQGGNNIFIDDININGIVGFNTVSRETQKIIIYPNPASNKAFIDINSEMPAPLNYSLENIMGQKVYSSPVSFISAGHQLIEIKRPLAGGMYFLKVQTSHLLFESKIIFE